MSEEANRMDRIISDLLSLSKIEINEKLEDSADLVNTDPYGDGWLIKIKPTNVNEKDHLMNFSAYEEFVI